MAVDDRFEVMDNPEVTSVAGIQVTMISLAEKDEGGALHF